MSAKREIRFEGAPSAKREVLPTHPKGADETDEREARNPLKGAPSAQREVLPTHPKGAAHRR